MNKAEILGGIGIIIILTGSLKFFAPSFFDALLAAVIFFGAPLLVLVLFAAGIYMVFEGIFEKQLRKQK